MALGEFELIRRYFAAARHAESDGVLLGIGDDCALLAPPAGQVLAVSIDSMAEGTHFLPGTAPAHIATRLLGAAASDLAAMGATPAWLTLALTLPGADEAWLEPFAEALAATARRLGLALVGGDTTRGPLVLSAQVHGFVPAGQALTRSGAQPGDLICVTGTLGDSRGGLETLLQEDADDPHVAFLRQRFYRPSPRLATGVALRGLATACIDISDGLGADLGHLLDRSGVGAELDAAALPLSAALCAYAGERQAQQWALSGGEDYELCFTLPPQQRARLAALPEPVTVVGEIVAEPGLRLRQADRTRPLALGGFDHFA